MGHMCHMCQDCYDPRMYHDCHMGYKLCLCGVLEKLSCYFITMCYNRTTVEDNCLSYRLDARKEWYNMVNKNFDKILYVSEYLESNGMHYYYVVYKSGVHRIYYPDSIPRYIVDYMGICVCKEKIIPTIGKIKRYINER